MTPAGYRGIVAGIDGPQRHGDWGQWRNGDHDADVVVVTVAPGWIPCARYIDFNGTKE
jgi:hypothetical protein